MLASWPKAQCVGATGSCAFGSLRCNRSGLSRAASTRMSAVCTTRLRLRSERPFTDAQRSSSDKYRSLRSHYLSDWERNLTNTYESIKADLMRQNRDLGAPAVYTIETKLTYPVEETLLPVAKRSLVRYIETTKM